ncbi:hypothetical protein, partial [Marinimicrobium sp. UBA4509]
MAGQPPVKGYARIFPEFRKTHHYFLKSKTYISNRTSKIAQETKKGPRRGLFQSLYRLLDDLS